MQVMKVYDANEMEFDNMDTNDVSRDYRYQQWTCILNTWSIACVLLGGGFGGE